MFDAKGVDNVVWVYSPDKLTGEEEYAERYPGVENVNGQLVALSETGMESLPVADWYTTVLLPLLREYPVAYVCVWRNAYQNPTHFYTPYKGHPAEADFKAFTEDGRILMAGEF